MLGKKGIKRFLFDVEQYPEVCEPVSKVNNILSLILYIVVKVMLLYYKMMTSTKVC